MERNSAVRVALSAAGCVALLAVFSVIPVFVNTALGYVPVMACAFTLALSFAYLMVLKGKVQVEEAGVTQRCLRREDLRFQLRVSNRSLLPAVRVELLFYISDLFGGEGSSSVRHVTLPPRSDKTFDFTARFDHIGSYEVGVKRVEVGDPFGVFFSTLVHDGCASVDVEPRIVDIEDLELSNEATTEAKLKFRTVINDGMDYSGVREYRWGDPIKAIHWKLSARGEDYFTRLYETVSNPGVGIVVDVESPAYGTGMLMSVYDTLVETALSVARFADAAGMESELVFLGRAGEAERLRETEPLRTAALLARLPLVCAGTGERALDLLRREAQSLHAQNNLVFCTANVGEATIDTLVRIRNRKLTPMLLAVVPEHMDADALKELTRPLRRLSSLGVYYLVVSAAAELGVGSDAA